MQQNNVTVGRQIFRITAYSLEIIHYVYKTPQTYIERMQTLKFENVYIHVPYTLSKFIINDYYCTKFSTAMNLTTLSNSDLSFSVGLVLCIYNASDSLRCCVFRLISSIDTVKSGLQLLCVFA